MVYAIVVVAIGKHELRRLGLRSRRVERRGQTAVIEVMFATPVR
jgi:hypothetical protein